MKSTIAGVITISVLLALYIAVVGYRAVLLLTTGDPIGVLMGIALLVLPMIGLWALVRELVFGVRSAALVKKLEIAGQMPSETVATHPSGRPVREDADKFFPAYRAAVEAAPESWQAWMRLGMVYDACGDRRRARQAVNQAIKFSR